MGNGYQSSFNLLGQWNELVDMLSRMKMDENTMKKISEKADENFEYLKKNGKLL